MGRTRRNVCPKDKLENKESLTANDRGQDGKPTAPAPRATSSKPAPAVHEGADRQTCGRSTRQTTIKSSKHVLKTPKGKIKSASTGRARSVDGLRSTPHTRIVSEDLICSQHLEPGVEVGWDSNSPDALRHIQYVSKSKQDGSDNIRDIVRELAVETEDALSCTPPLLGLWMNKDDRGASPENTRLTRPLRCLGRRSRTAPSAQPHTMMPDDLLKQLAEFVQEHKDPEQKNASSTSTTNDIQKSTDGAPDLTSPVSRRKSHLGKRLDMASDRLPSPLTAPSKANGTADDLWASDEDDLFNDDSFLMKATQLTQEAFANAVDRISSPRSVKRRHMTSTPDGGKPPKACRYTFQLDSIPEMQLTDTDCQRTKQSSKEIVRVNEITTDKNNKLDTYKMNKQRTELKNLSSSHFSLSKTDPDNKAKPPQSDHMAASTALSKTVQNDHDTERQKQQKMTRRNAAPAPFTKPSNGRTVTTKHSATVTAKQSGMKSSDVMRRLEESDDIVPPTAVQFADWRDVSVPDDILCQLMEPDEVLDSQVPSVQQPSVQQPSVHVPSIQVPSGQMPMVPVTSKSASVKLPPVNNPSAKLPPVIKPSAREKQPASSKDVKAVTAIDDSFMDDGLLTEPDVLAMLEQVESQQVNQISKMPKKGSTSDDKASEDMDLFERSDSCHQVAPPASDDVPLQCTPEQIAVKKQEAIRRRHNSQRRASGGDRDDDLVSSQLSMSSQGSEVGDHVIRCSPEQIQAKKQEAIQRRQNRQRQLSNGEIDNDVIMLSQQSISSQASQPGSQVIHCSPEEIETKKQQAIVRRQNRLRKQSLGEAENGVISSQTSQTGDQMLQSSPKKRDAVNKYQSSRHSDHDVIIVTSSQNSMTSSQGSWSDDPPLRCTPEEIETKRREAIKRRQNKLKLDRRKQPPHRS